MPYSYFMLQIHRSNAQSITIRPYKVNFSFSSFWLLVFNEVGCYLILVPIQETTDSHGMHIQEPTNITFWFTQTPDKRGQYTQTVYTKYKLNLESAHLKKGTHNNYTHAHKYKSIVENASEINTLRKAHTYK